MTIAKTEYTYCAFHLIFKTSNSFKLTDLLTFGKWRWPSFCLLFPPTTTKSFDFHTPPSSCVLGSSAFTGQETQSVLIQQFFLGVGSPEYSYTTATKCFEENYLWHFDCIWQDRLSVKISCEEYRGIYRWRRTLYVVRFSRILFFPTTTTTTRILFSPMILDS